MVEKWGFRPSDRYTRRHVTEGGVDSHFLYLDSRPSAYAMRLAEPAPRGNLASPRRTNRSSCDLGKPDGIGRVRRICRI